jgi:hypothetical protein
MMGCLLGIGCMNVGRLGSCILIGNMCMGVAMMR